MPYWKALAWTAAVITLLTAAQYGSVRLLSGRPSSWLFEASLDLGPPLLFTGDTVQYIFAKGSQAALRDQWSAVLVGMLVNISIYSIVVWIASWVFTSARSRR